MFRCADLPLILEAAVNRGPTLKDPDELTDRIREDLGRLVCERFRDEEGQIRVLALQPGLEAKLREAERDGNLALAPAVLERLLSGIGELWCNSQRQQLPLALLSDRRLHRPLKRILARPLGDLGTLTYQEIPSDAAISIVAMVSEEDVFPAQDARCDYTTDRPSGRDTRWRGNASRVDMSDDCRVLWMTKRDAVQEQITETTAVCECHGNAGDIRCRPDCDHAGSQPAGHSPARFPFGSDHVCRLSNRSGGRHCLSSSV